MGAREWKGWLPEGLGLVVGLMAASGPGLSACTEHHEEVEGKPSVVTIEHAPPGYPAAPMDQRADLEVQVRIGEAIPPGGAKILLKDQYPGGCGTGRLQRAVKAWTDGGGRVTFRGVYPGGYSLLIDGNGLPLVERQIRVPQDRRVVVALPAGPTIAGVVVDDRGKPVPGAVVHLFMDGPFPTDLVSISVTDSRGRNHYAVRSIDADDHGRFIAYGMPRGRYAATANIRYTFPGQALEVKPGDSGVRLSIPVTGHLAGRVAGLEGWQAMNCEVGATLPVRPEAAGDSGSYVGSLGTFSELLEPVDQDSRPEYMYIWREVDERGRFDIPAPCRGPFHAFVRCRRSPSSGLSAGPTQVISPPAEELVLVAPPPPT